MHGAPQEPREPSVDDPRAPWAMLALLTAGFIAMTLNWFDIAAAFGPIGAELGLDLPAIGLLIAVFVAGYGICHIPGGFLATRWGMRPVLSLGLALEAVTAALSAAAPGYGVLLVLRIACGIGASVFAAIGVAGVSVWFPRRHLALALGISSAGFSVGATLGLYVWAELTQALGWRPALALGGALGLVVAALIGLFFRVPAGSDALHGVRLSRRAVRETMGNRNLWLYGIAFFGAYGGFFAGSQLIAGYGAEGKHLGAGEVALAAFLVGIAGIPGSVAGGWLSDRLANRRGVFTAAAALEGLFLILVPLSGPGWFWLPAFGIGFLFNFGFSVWQTVPASGREVSEENLGTAVGLMLTVAAVGGFVLPYGFGRLVPTAGYAAAWAFLGVLSILTALAGLLVRPTGPAEACVPAAAARGGRDEVP